MYGIQRQRSAGEQLEHHHNQLEALRGAMEFRSNATSWFGRLAGDFAVIYRELKVEEAQCQLGNLDPIALAPVTPSESMDIVTSDNAGPPIEATP